ncbi:MAG: damage-inducible protein DinB [Rhodospirillaceae bacterium]|jgi:uncharacterized damage-inducible protein DinB|nr:damage-inducible protein DinB [Rhodospirillaceae bacterium]MBT6118300.1 damage-inducible protein DinB [Rhodospirillaceae bacterium]
MNTVEMFRKLAGFNAWANGKIYESCAALSDDALREDRGAFFGSILATLNHLLVVDRGWISRVEGVESGVKSLDQILHDDLAELRRAREAEDARLIRLCDGLTQDSVDRVVSYEFMDGTPAETPLDVILITLFNHQTHHRGQIHAMLTQAGRPSLDLDIIVHDFEREAA